MTTPAIALAAALALSATAFAYELALLWRRRPAPPLAPARGRARDGVRYALTTAFLPWTKESARRHRGAYALGIGYHVGIAALLAAFVAALAHPTAGPPRVLALPLGLGLACAAALAVRRATDRRVRALSTGDDWFAAASVGATLALGVAATLRPAALPAFEIAGALLALYAPLGKLRHMVLLFPARILWGIHFGHRGVVARNVGAVHE